MGRAKGYESTLKNEDARRYGARVALRPSLVNRIKEFVAGFGDDSSVSVGDVVESIVSRFFDVDVLPGGLPVQDHPQEATVEANADPLDDFSEDEADCYDEIRSAWLTEDERVEVAKVMSRDDIGEYDAIKVLGYRSEESALIRKVFSVPLKDCISIESEISGVPSYWVKKEFEQVFGLVKRYLSDQRISLKYELEDIARALSWLEMDKNVWWSRGNGRKGYQLRSATAGLQKDYPFRELHNVCLQVVLAREKQQEEARRATMPPLTIEPEIAFVGS